MSEVTGRMNSCKNGADCCCIRVYDLTWLVETLAKVNNNLSTWCRNTRLFSQVKLQKLFREMLENRACQGTKPSGDSSMFVPSFGEKQHFSSSIFLCPSFIQDEVTLLHFMGEWGPHCMRYHTGSKHVKLVVGGWGGGGNFQLFSCTNWCGRLPTQNNFQRNRDVKRNRILEWNYEKTRGTDHDCQMPGTHPHPNLQERDTWLPLAWIEENNKRSINLVSSNIPLWKQRGGVWNGAQTHIQMMKGFLIRTGEVKRSLMSPGTLVMHQHHHHHLFMMLLQEELQPERNISSIPTLRGDHRLTCLPASIYCSCSFCCQGLQVRWGLLFQFVSNGNNGAH